MLRSFSPATLIGNWFEERFEQADRLARETDPTVVVPADCDACLYGERMRHRWPTYDWAQVACERCRDRQVVLDRMHKSCMKQVISMSLPSAELPGVALQRRNGAQWTAGHDCDLCRFGERFKNKMPVYDWPAIFARQRAEVAERRAKQRQSCMRTIFTRC